MSGFSLEFTRRYCMAHRLLAGIAPKCAFPHGHNKYVRVKLAPRDTLPLDGVGNMVEEFGAAKRMWHQWIDDAASDWALIGIDEIRATMGSDDRILGTLAKFREGMVRHARELVPAVAVTSFQELGVADHLPLGLPTSGSSREAWLRAFMEASGISVTPALAELLGYAGQRENLRDLVDWRAFASVARSPHRSTVIDCLKVYHNICRLRFAALSNEEQRRLGDIKSEAASDLRHEAYLDAILRLVQYQLYAKLAVEHFGRSVCCYQDPGFTACGNLFRLSEFPVLFLDPLLVIER